MRKKLFAVIMSAMMMITFMPTMAFAYTPVGGQTAVTIDRIVYSGDYSTATAYGHVTGDTTKKVTLAGTFDSDAEKATFDAASGAMKETFLFEDADYFAGKVTKYFYNFADSKIVNASNKQVTELEAPWDTTNMTVIPKSGNVPAHYEINDNTDTTPIGNFVRFVNPAKKTASKQVSIFELLEELDGLLDIQVQSVDLEQLLGGSCEFPVYMAKTEYDLTVYGGVAGDLSANAEENTFTDEVVGVANVASTKQSVTIKFDEDMPISSVPVKVNGVETDLLLEPVIDTEYTGENVKVELLTKGLLDVQYQLVDYSGKTSNWSATFPEIKDAGNYVINVKVTKTFGDKASLEFQQRVSVDPYEVYGCFKFSINQTASVPMVRIHEGQEVANKDILALYTYEEKLAKLTDADLATWNKIVEKYAEVDGLENTVGSYYLSGKLSKDVWSDTDAEIVKFLSNFELMVDDTSDYAWTNIDDYYFEGMMLEVVEGKNDVTAPNKTVTYKAKKGKLSKNKIYTLKATADWGTCSYTKMNTKGGSKIKVAKSGKVTIKKGLKKGTYKVKIKVKAPGAKDNMYLTVKVK